MPLSTQFALTLELNKIVQSTVSASVASVVKLLQEFSDSRSDYVVEEGVAGLFERHRIDESLQSSFKAAIHESGSSESIWEGIHLRFGPGPSVLRAFKEKRYVPMIMLCSMLSSVYEIPDLAQAIHEKFEQELIEKLAQDPHSTDLGSSPSLQAIKGVLQACQDQTAPYDWGLILLSIATRLGLQRHRSAEAIPPVVLRSVIGMFPIVKHIPEGRLVHIKCGYGVCILVAWAHTLLGLSVLVRYYRGTEFVEKLLGKGRPQVIIEDYGSDDTMRHAAPSIVLFQTSDREKLFEFKPDLDDRSVEGDLKRPLQGYGSFILQWNAESTRDHENLFKKFKNLAVTMAILISKDLRYVSRANLQPSVFLDTDSDSEISIPDGDPGDLRSMEDIEEDGDLENQSATASYTGDDDEKDGEPWSERAKVDEGRIFASARCLFGEDFRRSHIFQNVAKYARSTYNYNLRPRDAILAQIMLDFDNDKKQTAAFFEKYVPILRYLSIIILAGAHIKDLELARNLPISCNLTRLSAHPLADQLLDWNIPHSMAGVTQDLQLSEDAWLHAFALLMVGSESDFDDKSTVLVSSRGWSVYLNSISDVDPSYTERSVVVVQRGVPFRGQVCKHYVVDGPQSRENLPLNVLFRSGEKIDLGSAKPTATMRPIIGEKPDSFVVGLIIRDHNARGEFLVSRFSGYREFCAAIWGTHVTKPCDHPKLARKVWKLPPDCLAITGENTDCSGEEERVIVCLTSGNAAARWRALVSLASTRDRAGEYGAQKPTMVRRDDCCCDCAVKQCLKWQGQCYLVL